MAGKANDLFNVLVINDDIQQRERITSMIAGRCKVDAPSTYEEMMGKVHLLKKIPQAYALVILDYVLELWPLPIRKSAEENLPKDGFEVLQLLRPTKRERQPLVYFLTNFPNPALMKQVRREYGVYAAQYSNMTPLNILDDVESLLGLK